jgi:tetratricopeptide (TPR) repeat protein
VAAGAAPFAKARIYMQARDYQQAIQQFQLAIQRHQHVPDSYAGIGTADLELRKYAGSYRAYRAAARLQPANPAYLYYAAYSALYAQDFHGSVTYATRYLRLRPASPEGYHLRFLAYGQLLNRHKQLLDAQTYVRLRPKSADAQNDLGIALANNAKYVPAVQAFSRAIALKPSFAQYYIERATVENLNHQPTLVLRDLEKARALAGNTAEGRQLEQAISQYKKQMSH